VSLIVRNLCDIISSL